MTEWPIMKTNNATDATHAVRGYHGIKNRHATVAIEANTIHGFENGSGEEK